MSPKKERSDTPSANSQEQIKNINSETTVPEAAAAANDAPAIRERSIEFTLFESLEDKTGKRYSETWPELVAMLRDAKPRPEREMLKLVKLGTFRGGCSTEHLVSITGVEGDYDGGQVTIDEAARRLERWGMKALLHTTGKHRPDAPRWRVLAPLSQSREPAERRELVGRLNGALGGILAPESFTDVQRFYVGCVEGVAYEVLESDGDFLDEMLAPPVEVYPLDERAPRDDDPFRAAERAQTIARADDQTIELLRSAVQGLDPERLRDFPSWSRVVGLPLKSLRDGPLGEQAHELLHEASKRVPERYDAAKVDRWWRSGAVPDDITWTSVLALAKEDGWKNPGRVESEPAPADGRPRFQPVQIAELARTMLSGYLVKGVLPRAELATIYGESTVGKSFVVLDLCFAIARGVPWRDCRVRAGRVVYVAAEGAGGVGNRLLAYERKHGIDIASLPFRAITDQPNFLSPGDDREMAKQIEAAGGADLIVIDTFAQVTPGGNENASEDVGRALAACKRLHKATGATVLLVHHQGKDASRGARGWSGLKAAVDAELLVDSNEKTGRTVRITKSKEGVAGTVYPFRLEVVAVGIDEDGDALSSCVVEHLAALPEESAREPSGGVQRKVYRVAKALIDEHGQGPTPAELIEAAIPTLDAPEVGGRDRRRDLVRAAIKGLQEGDSPFLFLTEGGRLEPTN
jgi:hypothetical protein